MGIIVNLLHWKKSNVLSQSKPQMLSEDALIVSRYAQGESSLMKNAQEVYYKYLPILGARGSVEQEFMSEMLSPVPDLGRRGKLRFEILAQSKPD